VTAIRETLLKTNLRTWKSGTLVNLERCMAANGRFDGHIVQGHVDLTAECTAIETDGGSWRYFFRFSEEQGHLVVEKGSITINGVSLTVVDAQPEKLSVAIIPYTYQHTNFKQLQAGDPVNIEFDIIGKYVQ
ncbi:MAG: riboflavin synthase subunit alpha, partial [Phototrophicales bacterium]